MKASGQPRNGAASEPRGPDSPSLHELERDFEILAEVGRGGTAVVYRAMERELGRQVAIKVVRASHVEDEEAIARLEREAKLVAMLRHPNIVTLFGTRPLSSGGIALIMQYVPGRTLKQAIREEGPLPIPAVLSILHEIGSALDYAHRRHGIVHRDIKPENIYLDGEHGHAMLADFGIARVGEDESSLTLVGMALGTPAYMSPEQIEGEALDGRSDLYSLGLVAYEMLTGRQPWEGSNLYGIIYRQKHEELGPLADLRPDAPEYLRHAVDGLLRKDRALRWRDAAELLGRLDPGAGPPPALPRRSPPPARSRSLQEDAPTLRYDREAARAFVPEPASDSASAAPPAGQAITRPRRRAGVRTAVRVIVVLLVSTATTPAVISSPDVERSGEQSADSVVPDPPLHQADPAAAADPLGATGFRTASGDGQRAPAGSALPEPLRVQVQDAAGEPLPGVEVEFEVVAGGGNVMPPLAATDDSGIAAAIWTLGAAGPNEVLARAGALADARTSFVATAYAPGPARIMLLSGDGQEGTRGSPLPRDVVIRVEDESGSPLDGVPVEFRALSGGGSVAPAAARTAGGTARARWTLGPEVGSQTLIAEVPDAGLRVTLGATTRYLLDVTAGLTAGGTHSCRLASSGRAGCWGGNANGQLGAGGTVRQGGVATVAVSAPLARIAAGVSHTCALDRDGAALCWGINDEGQLGTGNRDPRDVPAPVRGVEHFVSISAGLDHTCALTADGRAFCWGGGAYGQLGDGAGTARLQPSPVAGGHRFRSLSAGWSHTCGVTDRQVAYCWGVNGEGQLGDGTTADRAMPTRVAADLLFAEVSAGATHTCGITVDHEAYCWGEPLGGDAAGTTVPSNVEAPVPFTTIAAGALHACALAGDGQAYCWGRNNTGQLGNGETADAPLPVRVAGSLRFTALTTTGSHTCARAASGQDYCWGYNLEGQLGDGSRIRRTGPVRVSLSNP